jgi:hypothetical protein
LTISKESRIKEFARVDSVAGQMTAPAKNGLSQIGQETGSLHIAFGMTT